MKAEPADGTTNIHNVRFYNLEPRSISNFAYNTQNRKLALSRSDDCIEIWNLSNAAFLEKTIVVLPKSSVESLVWCGDRLFSASLSGEISEWDLGTLQRKSTKLVTGNAIWCLDVNKSETCLAAGTEEGYLNSFDVVEGELIYNKLFDKQEGRILCCKFDHSGEFIVTGSLDVIRIWSTKTGHAIHKMSMGRNAKKHETIVWSIQVLSDFTIISGDSRGQVTVWDGKIGSQIESHQALKADVLAVAVNDKENVFVCSGVDPTIRIYTLTTIKKEDRTMTKWVKLLQRTVHEHDVKALVCAGDRIISGGVDGYLGISSFSKLKQNISKHGPFLQQPCVSVALEARLILLRYWDYLEIWKLGKAGKTDLDVKSQDQQKLLNLECGPDKLLEMKSRNGEPIVSAAMSPDGSYLAYTTTKSIRLFIFVAANGENQTALARVKDVPRNFSPSTKILFSADSKMIFLAKSNNTIDVFSIAETGEIDFVDSVDVSRNIKDTIYLLTISPCGNYLIVAGTCRTICVWTKQKRNRWKHYLKLPQHVAHVTAISVHQNLPRLVAAFADGKIYEYDIEEMRFTASACSEFVPNYYKYCVNSIVLDPRNENILILNNDRYLFVLEKCSPDEEGSKEKRVVKTEETETVSSLKLKFQKTYEHFVHMAWLSLNEMIAVGVNPVSLIEQLPETMRQKKFGAS